MNKRKYMMMKMNNNNLLKVSRNNYFLKTNNTYNKFMNKNRISVNLGRNCKPYRNNLIKKKIWIFIKKNLPNMLKLVNYQRLN